MSHCHAVFCVDRFVICGCHTNIGKTFTWEIRKIKRELCTVKHSLKKSYIYSGSQSIAFYNGDWRRYQEPFLRVSNNPVDSK